MQWPTGKRPTNIYKKLHIKQNIEQYEPGGKLGCNPVPLVAPVVFFLLQTQ